MDSFNKPVGPFCLAQPFGNLPGKVSADPHLMCFDAKSLIFTRIGYYTITISAANCEKPNPF